MAIHLNIYSKYIYMYIYNASYLKNEDMLNKLNIYNMSYIPYEIYYK